MSKAPLRGLVAAAREISRALLAPLPSTRRDQLEMQLARMKDSLRRLEEAGVLGAEKLGARGRQALDFLLRASSLAPFEPLPRKRRVRADRFHRLDELWTAVVAKYFDDEMKPAAVLWSPRPSWTRLGFYDRRSDRIVISQSLDHPAVPREAIERILFHEALHRVVGIEVRKGRRVIHGSTFKSLEKKFEHFRSTEKFFREVWPRLARGDGNVPLPPVRSGLTP